MSAMKPLALGILAWVASGSVVRADPITWPNNFNWVAYFAGQNGNGGVNPALASTTPAAAAAPVAIQPASSQAVTPQPATQQAAATAPITLIANAPVMQPQSPPPPPPVAAAPVAAGPVDAFINLGSGPYPLQNSITTGNAQPWYDSAQIASLFGGQPTAQQIQSFDNAVLSRVQQTFSLSGASVTLTDNSNVAALHTVSLVSNTQSSSLSSAIGMSQVGASGFSFINNIASSAQSVDQLEWIVAHNISHELMLAFGVPEDYDKTGNYIDSRVADWAMMVNPASTFSPAAALAITDALAGQSTAGSAAYLAPRCSAPRCQPFPSRRQSPSGPWRARPPSSRGGAALARASGSLDGPYSGHGRADDRLPGSIAGLTMARSNHESTATLRLVNLMTKRNSAFMAFCS